MEIERKFLMDSFPEETPICILRMAQGYLALKPTVRIRSSVGSKGTEYRLCIKGKGDLVREEIELPLDEEQFCRLSSLLCGPLIEKEQRQYVLPDGHVLECNQVEPDSPDGFCYGEVEFETVEEALAFQPPQWFGKEVTGLSGYSMADYWRKTRLARKGGFWVYMLRCGDGSYYTGWTNNMTQRVADHQRGKGSRYTRSHLPVELVYAEEWGSKGEAMSREYAIKQLTRGEKEKLVANWDATVLIKELTK